MSPPHYMSLTPQCGVRLSRPITPCVVMHKLSLFVCLCPNMPVCSCTVPVSWQDVCVALYCLTRVGCVLWTNCQDLTSRELQAFLCDLCKGHLYVFVPLVTMLLLLASCDCCWQAVFVEVVKNTLTDDCNCREGSTEWQMLQEWQGK